MPHQLREDQTAASAIASRIGAQRLCAQDVMCLEDRLTVLVGNNGSGKSSLLDALAIAAGAFLQGLRPMACSGISERDAHSKPQDMDGAGLSQLQLQP